MRQLLSLLLISVACAACAPAASPRPTPAPAPTIAAVGELVSAPAAGTIEVIGYLLVRPDGAVLADRLRFDGAVPAIPAAAPAPIWIGDPGLPPEAPLQRADNLSYSVAVVRGTLEGPGAFGPAGDLPYRLGAAQVRLLSLRDLTIPLLLSNSGLYEGQPVRLSGQILISPSSALLVEELGQGGVPAAGALQVKIVAPISDPELTGRLRAAGDGAIHYGPAQLIGVWRRGSLYPLAIIPQP